MSTASALRAMAAGLLLAHLAALPAEARPRRAVADSTRTHRATDSTAVGTLLAAASPALPLIVDTADPGFGASLVFTRVPGARDLEAIPFLDANVRHIVLALPSWPEDYGQLEPLGRVVLPEGTDVLVVLHGYPPSRAATSAWNLLRQPLRIVLLVDGPPVDRGMITELNVLRGLERVIATMAHPSRSGFERLQRPLSFRVLMP